LARTPPLGAYPEHSIILFLYRYNQDELVKVNDYQNSDTREIIKFWELINKRMLYIIKKQSKKTLNYKIELEKDNFSDLRFLINDYVDHLEHHIKTNN
jgi:hypothetical protein